MNVTSLRDVLFGQKRLPFYRKLNIWDILDQTVVGVDLQMSALLELSNFPDVTLASDSDIENHLRNIQSLLQSLSDNITLQFIVQCREGDPDRIAEFNRFVRTDAADELTKRVVDAKTAHLKAKFLQRRRYYLAVTTYKQPLDKVPRFRLTSLLNDKVDQTAITMHTARVRGLNAVVSSVQDSLRSLKIKSTRFSDDQLLEFYHHYLNPNSSQITHPLAIEKYRQSGHTLRSVLAQSAVEHDYNYLKVDGDYVQGVNMLGLPELVGPTNITHLVNALWPNYDLCFTLHCEDTRKLLGTLKSSANWANALSLSGFGNRYEAKHKHTELTQLISELTGSSQRLMKVSLAIIQHGRDEHLLHDNTSSALKAFNSMYSAEGLVDNLNHEDLFLSVLPNHSHFNHRQHVMNSNTVAAFLPLAASWAGTPEARLLFENRQGELIPFNMFDPSLPAKHAIVVGSTGSGKSFTTNYLLTNFFIESSKNHLIIIDVGGSYRRLCHLFGGQYFDVELSEEFGFNFFPAKKSIAPDETFEPDDLAYLTLIMLPMVLDHNEAINNAGETLLENAIKTAYRTLAPDDSPILEDIANAIHETAGDSETTALARHYFKNLEMWTKGRYSQIFNNRRRMMVESRMIVFDLGKLGPHKKLQSVYFHVIRQIIDNKFKDLSLRKMIVIDEGWKLFDDEVGAQLVENLYRTARKFNAAVLSISQNPIDFLKTKAATAIIANTLVKYVLRLGSGHELLPQFGLTNSEVEAVKGLQTLPRKYSDIFVRFNEDPAILRLEPSALDYWICTTDAQDTVKEEAFRRAHPEWSNEELLTELAKSGTGAR